MDSQLSSRRLGISPHPHAPGWTTSGWSGGSTGCGPRSRWRRRGCPASSRWPYRSAARASTGSTPICGPQATRCECSSWPRSRSRTHVQTMPRRCSPTHAGESPSSTPSCARWRCPSKRACSPASVAPECVPRARAGRGLAPIRHGRAPGPGEPRAGARRGRAAHGPAGPGPRRGRARGAAVRGKGTRRRREARGAHVAVRRGLTRREPRASGLSLARGRPDC